MSLLRINAQDERAIIKSMIEKKKRRDQELSAKREQLRAEQLEANRKARWTETKE